MDNKSYDQNHLKRYSSSHFYEGSDLKCQVNRIVCRGTIPWSIMPDTQDASQHKTVLLSPICFFTGSPSLQASYLKIGPQRDITEV